MWRKTVVATAIVGAGFAATTGSAFAGEGDLLGSVAGDHESSSKSSDHGKSEDHAKSDEHGKDHGKDHGKKDHKDEGKHEDDEKRGAGDQCGSDVSTDSDGETTQNGLVNVADTDTIVPSALCDNNVPANILGVQIPIQDAALDIPLLSPSDDDGGNSASVN